MSEREYLSGAPAAIGMAVLAFLFLGVVFAIYPTWGVIGNFLNVNIRLTTEAPAWMQAFVMLITMFGGLISFFVFKFQERKDANISKINNELIYIRRVKSLISRLLVFLHDEIVFERSILEFKIDCLKDLKIVFYDIDFHEINHRYIYTGMMNVEWIINGLIKYLVMEMDGVSQKRLDDVLEASRLCMGDFYSQIDKREKILVNKLNSFGANDEFESESNSFESKTFYKYYSRIRIDKGLEL